MRGLSSFNELEQHFKQISKLSILDLFKQDADRGSKFFYTVNGIKVDLSKNNITYETIDLLVKLAKQSNLTQKIEDMFTGVKINTTENRAVLHTALRNLDQEIDVDGKNIGPSIKNVLAKMQKFTHEVHSGIKCGYSGEKFTDIVNIGIGGSDLGPKLVTQALKPYRIGKLKLHFVSSVDGYQILDVLADLNPKTTLFVIASKTFTTEETMTNANTAKSWFLDHVNDKSKIKHHFVALSTNIEKVTQFGIDPNNIFEFWDFVGGRFSVWSAIGLSVMLYIGVDNFSQLLEGAKDMDLHFRNTTDYRQNLPVLLGLLTIWYVNFFNYSTWVISPYNTRLDFFPSYVQQLAMESNGKSVDVEGKPLDYKTCPIIWGGSGINGQHAYYQLLHQGTSINPMDIILALSDQFSVANHQNILVSNAFAQAEAFMCGQDTTQIEDKKLAPHKVFMANRPTNMILLPEISPYSLGSLIALYEHKTYVEGIIWGINSFDQMGVELGKVLAKNILREINSKNVVNHDSSTTELIECYLNQLND